MTDFGLMTLDQDEAQPFLGYEMAQGHTVSEETASRIDSEVQKLLQERFEYTLGCLQEHRDDLDKLVEELIAHETVKQDTLEKILE